MRVLMVCLGNICRSPMAEAVLAHHAPAWVVDSAGTSAWHVGEVPDHRATAVLRQHGIVRAHRGRQVSVADFTRFDRIYAMDNSNLNHLMAMRSQDATARLELLGVHDPQGMTEVPDPYYDGPEAFEAVYEQILRCCQALIGDRAK